MLGLSKIGKRLFGSVNDRQLRQYNPKIDAINALEPEIEALSDDALRGKTDEFRTPCKMARLLTTFWWKPLQLFAKPPSAPWVSGTLTYR